MWSSKSAKDKSCKDEKSPRDPTRDSDTRKSERSKDKFRTDVARKSGSAVEPKRSEVVGTSLGINNIIGQMGIPIKRGWRYILKHLTPVRKIQCRSKVPKSEEQPQRNSGIPRNDLHCYGWIESDEDEDDRQDFIYLRPASENIEAKETSAPNLPNRTAYGTEYGRNRKSRWDVKPDDP